MTETNTSFISEEGETLEGAALRELEEETGLVLTPAEKKTSSILGLWESVYPPVLPMGLPKRHHIVVYLHVVLTRTSQDLQNNFKVRVLYLHIMYFFSFVNVDDYIIFRGSFVRKDTVMFHYANNYN